MKWFDSFFFDVFPIRYVLRVVDSFILEGSKILIRFGLGFLLCFEKNLLDLISQKQSSHSISLNAGDGEKSKAVTMDLVIAELSRLAKEMTEHIFEKIVLIAFETFPLSRAEFAMIENQTFLLWATLLVPSPSDKTIIAPTAASSSTPAVRSSSCI